jgi:hypothetical protein
MLTGAMQGSKKSRKASKKDNIGDADDDGGYACVDTQSSSSCTSEDGNFEGNTNSSSKKTCARASRGAATEPQSLYARVSKYKKFRSFFSFLQKVNTNRLQK